MELCKQSAKTVSVLPSSVGAELTFSALFSSFPSNSPIWPYFLIGSFSINSISKFCYECDESKVFIRTTHAL